MNQRTLIIIERLSIRLLGLLILVFSFFYAVSLLSFSGEDPSFNTASTEDLVRNYMGVSGACIADLSFQLIGLSSFVLVLVVFSIGIKMVSSEGVKNLFLKLIFLPVCVLAFSSFFAVLPNPEAWQFNTLGGFNGSFIIAKFVQIPRFLIATTSLAVAVATFSFLVEVSLADWVYYCRYLLASIGYLLDSKLNLNLSNPSSQNSSNSAGFFGLSSKNNPMEVQDPSQTARFLAKRRVFIEQEEENFITDFSSRPLESDLEDDYAKKRGRNMGENRAELISQIKKSGNKNLIKKASYHLPSVELLTDRSAENRDKKVSRDFVETQSKMLVKILEDFGVYGAAVAARVGPVVTLHEFEPSAGTKASRVISLSDDIARSMSAISARIAVVSGKTSIGIELPNQKREMIFLRELLESKEYRFSNNFLPIILGKDISGEIMIADLAKMPHLLIAGTTGSGKSVGLNVMILSLLYRLRPNECKFIMIDPKMLELSIYDGIPHLLSPVVTEPAKAVIALKWVVAEMEERYRLMSSFAVRNIAGYNEKAEKALLDGEKLMRKVQTGYDPATGKPVTEEIEFEPKKLPFIVVIVDEMADLMLVAGKEIENSVQRLAQMARAAGIHLIMATQRPSVDVITGVIKANFPTRISFQVTSRIDSRTILGIQGAEQLLGQGDMIYMSGGSKMTRVHGPFCSDTEIENIVNFIKSQDLSEFEDGEKISFEAIQAKLGSSSADGEVSEGDGNSDDDLYNKALAIVRRDKKASISYVQRQLRIGYNRAAILIEKMEENGVITAPNIAGKRELIEE